MRPWPATPRLQLPHRPQRLENIFFKSPATQNAGDLKYFIFSTPSAVSTVYALTQPVHSEKWPSPITQKTLWARDYDCLFFAVLLLPMLQYKVAGEERLLRVSPRVGALLK